MKDLLIASVEALPCSVPLKQAVTQGLGSVTKRDTVVVKVTTAGGLAGYGEAYNGRQNTDDNTIELVIPVGEDRARVERWHLASPVKSRR